MPKVQNPYEPTEAMRVMRRFMLFTIPVAVIIAFVMAIRLRYAALTIGFVPMIYTCVLWNWLKALEKRKRKVSKSIVAFLDLFGALLYISACIPLWAGRIRAPQVFGNQSGWGEERLRIEKGMLVGHCSSIFLINVAIHLWLVLYDTTLAKFALSFWDGRCSRCRECPHCRAEDEEHGREPSGSRQKQADRGAAYSLLGEMAEDDSPVDNPRASGEA